MDKKNTLGESIGSIPLNVWDSIGSHVNTAINNCVHNSAFTPVAECLLDTTWHITFNSMRFEIGLLVSNFFQS